MAELDTTISIDIRTEPDCDSKDRFEIWIAHEGSSGMHYHDQTPEDIGRQVADYVECLMEGE